MRKLSFVGLQQSLTACLIAAPCTPHFVTAPDQGLGGSRTELILSWDSDGSGPLEPKLTLVNIGVSAGNISANSLAQWDGESWSTAPVDPLFPTRPGGYLRCATTFQIDTSGTSPPLIVVGGGFETLPASSPANLAAFDGTKWTSFGGDSPNTDVRCVAVFDLDETGKPALICGGDFTSIGGDSYPHVAAFDGQSWRSLGAGLPQSVLDLAVVDLDGTGPEKPTLFALAFPDGVGSQPQLWKFQSGGWSSIPNSFGNDTARVLHSTLVEGSPTKSQKLAIGGGFSVFAGLTSKYAVTWNGAAFEPLNGLPARVWRFANGISSTPDSDPPLYALVDWTNNYPGDDPAVPIIFEWKGGAWQSFGQTGRIPAGAPSAINGVVSTLPKTSDHLPRFFLFGGFESINGVPAYYMAQWDGSSWSTLGPTTDAPLSLLTRWNGKPGRDGRPVLVAAGASHIGAVPVPSRLAVWDGFEWQPIPSPTPSLTSFQSLSTFDPDGNGPRPPLLLLAGKHLATDPASLVLAWDGVNWLDLNSASIPSVGGAADVLCFAVHDPDGDGDQAPALYAGGRFASASGQPEACVLQWTGTQWLRVGQSLAASGGAPATVYAISSFDFGTAPSPQKSLVITGNFNSPRKVARLSANSFVAIGTGASVNGRSLCVVDSDGPGGQTPELFVGGDLGTGQGSVQKWTGTQWQSVGNSVGPVYSLTLFDDDGAGPQNASLYATGNFTQIASVPAKRIAKWSGTTWTSIGGGADGSVLAAATLGPYPDSDSELVLGGPFKFADSVVSKNWARLSNTGVSWDFKLGPDQSARCGKSAEFVVTQVAGYEAAALGWFHDSIPVLNGMHFQGSTVNGAHTTHLTLHKITAADAGEYTLQATGACGDSVMSPAIALVVPYCCPADFNADHVVDDADFSPFVLAYNLMLCSDPGQRLDCPEDLNNDGVVDDADFVLFLTAYGTCLCPD